MVSLFGAKQIPFGSFTINRDSLQAGGLVGWWPTLGSRGILLLNEYVTGRAEGQIQPRPVLVSNGLLGRILDLNGTDENVSVADFDVTFDFNSAFTITTWIYQDSAVINKGIISNWRLANVGGVSNHGIFVEIGASNQLRFAYRNNGATVFDISGAGSTVSANVWYFVVCVYNPAATSANAEIYFNGLSTGVTGNASTTFAITGRPLEIGSLSATETASLNRYFNGDIGGTRIYNRALTPIEVLDQYRNPWDLYQPLHQQPLGFVSAAPAGAVMNQFQGPNVGADLFDGTLLIR